MIRRIYIHNFRCLVNFELRLTALSSVLLIGKNGAGKTTVCAALEVLQKIARGTNRVRDLIGPRDIAGGGSSEKPMRFEIDVDLDNRNYVYTAAFEYPPGFRELRILEEKLFVDGSPVFTRELAQVQLAQMGQESGASFRIDWHLAALPIVQLPTLSDPIHTFRDWLANTLILRPIPSLAGGESESGNLYPNTQATNIGEWFTGLLASAPSAYTRIDSYLRQMMPDFQDIKNLLSGEERRSLSVQFSSSSRSVTFPFGGLSDGEKCFIIYALTIAANTALGPLLCFWDEPDNYLAPGEIWQSVMDLRKSFQSRGQLIVTSHNPEAVRCFSDDNTFLLYRNSHLEPTNVRSIEDLRGAGALKGDFVEALLRGDVGA